MEHDFPREIYRRACGSIRPFAQPEKEDAMSGGPRKIPYLKRKTVVVFASVLTLLFSMSVAAVAATDGQIVKDVAHQLIIWAEGITVDEAASTPEETVGYTKDGVKITIVHGQEKAGGDRAELIYHADHGRLGLKIGEEETDITERLLADGVYTEEYSFEGERFRVTVTGQPENAVLAEERIDGE